MVASPLLIDAGFLVAFLNDKDREHLRAVNAAAAWEEREWVTSWPVLTETVHLLPVALRHELLESQTEGLFDVVALRKEDVERLAQLLLKYRDRRLDLADASLIVLAERLNTGDILTCDRRDFSVVRWRQRKVFRNLMFE